MIKKSILHSSGAILSLIALVVVIAVALTLLPRASFSRASVDLLKDRLVQSGIAVEHVSIIKPDPLDLEIVINSSGDDPASMRKDLWAELITEREVELSYLNAGLKVNSYRLAFVLPDGSTTFDGTTFLYPNSPSQRVTPNPRSSVNTDQTRNILESNLALMGLKPQSFIVDPLNTTNDNSKAFTLLLTTGSPANQTDMDQINQFILSVGRQIEAINTRFDTNIVLLHIQITDSTESVLVDYLEDFQIGRQYSWTADFISGAWYPEPAPEFSPTPNATALPVVRVTATPPPLLPSPTTQRAAYPAPGTPNPYP